VIDAEQDVLDAEREIGLYDLPDASRVGNGECRLAWCQAYRLGGAIGSFHAGEHIGSRPREPFDSDQAAGEPADTGCSPALHVSPPGEPRSRFAARAVTRQPDIEPQAVITFSRDLPQHIVGFVANLAKLQETWTDLMGQGIARRCANERKDSCE
jgi:hypothetical protein